MSEKKISREERIRQYKIKMGAHKLKNRSTKSILSISKPRWDRYNIYRHVSRKQLEEWSASGNFEAEMELNRRIARADRRADNKAK